MPRSTRARGARPAATSEVGRAFQGFSRTVELVEDAKAALAAAAPRGRAAGVPLAEALSRFEEALAAASASMGEWKDAGFLDPWRSCDAALAESGRLAEELRLGKMPQGYEELYGTLADVMEPLDLAFEAGLRRFRSLGL